MLESPAAHARRATLIAAFGALLLASGPVAAAHAKPRLGHSYGGVTSQDAPFVLELARGSKVDRIRVLVIGQCSDGESLTMFATVDFETNIPAFVPSGDHVMTGGRLSKSGSFRASGLGSEDFGGAGGAVTEKVTGRIRRNGSASGTYRASVTLIDRQTNQPVADCHTGTIKWSARSARGRVFAGATSAGQPIVVELDRRRGSVEHLMFGWGAPCAPPETGGWLVPDHLRGFPLTGGSFGDTFQVPVDLDGGGKRAFDYTIQGSVGRSKASGSFSVKVTDMDGAGVTTSACDTGSVTWTARSG
jgi:hypothetical protein